MQIVHFSFAVQARIREIAETFFSILGCLSYNIYLNSIFFLLQCIILSCIFGIILVQFG